MAHGVEAGGESARACCASTSGRFTARDDSPWVRASADAGSRDGEKITNIDVRSSRKFINRSRRTRPRRMSLKVIDLMLVCFRPILLKNPVEVAAAV
jgi:hypothetical protein